jgi:N-acetylglucosaminyldiphosphoundecaprenol N-acetyl-beta-D-mannosaminyltransferase
MVLFASKEQESYPRANILGVGVHAVNMQRAVEMIEDMVECGEKGYVCLSGVHGIMEARQDSELRSIVNRAALVAPDGMPTVWLGWLQGLPNMRRVFGPDLMLEVCQRSVAKDFTHFLYGGNPSVAEQLKQNLECMFPGIRIVGIYTPPFRKLSRKEELHLRKRFSKLKPDITWVGLSTPKQDRFMARYISTLDTKVMIGVGAAFDMHTGRIRDCPEWMKPAGLQWLHRLWQEPSRLWHRYLYYNPLFVFHVALQLAGLRRYDLAPVAKFKRRTPLPQLDPANGPIVPVVPADFEQRAS